jgi:hypothetical protein
MDWVVSPTPRPLYLRERPGTPYTVGPRTAVDGAENLAPICIRSPDLPARSKSLYRLSHPDPHELQLVLLNTLLDMNLYFLSTLKSHTYVPATVFALYTATS